MVPPLRPWPWWRRLLTGLCALGVALSTYLAWHFVVGGSVIGCSGGSACDQVLGSKWSAIGGIIPVSGLATGAYLAMLLASLYLGSDTEASMRRLAWCVLLVLVGAAAGCAMWFIIVQKWFIGAFCPYCMATHLTSLVLATLVTWRAPREFAGVSSHPPAPSVSSVQSAPSSTAADLPTPEISLVGGPRITRPLTVNGLVLVGVAMAGVLAVCQVAFTPKDVFQAGESPVSNLPVLDPHNVPLVGSPNSPVVVTLVFDYECPHCQKLHVMLEEVIRRYNGKLAFVLCPAPLNTHCNPYIPRDVDAFKDSCNLTKIALAVWVANRAAFPDFDRWMFSPEPDQPWHPRSPDEATAKAVEMVGQAKFDAARANPWIDKYLQICVRIFGTAGAHAVPKLVFASHWANPEPNDPDDLISILQASLGVPKP